MNHLYAVIMAGGRGERFWPLGRQNTPKQMLKLLSKNTMIEETVLRLFPLVAPDHILVITNRQYVEHLRELLPIPHENIIGEPVGRDTAPCVALAAGWIRRLDPSHEAVMVLLPSDQVIKPAKALQQTIVDAVKLGTDSLVTIGVNPTWPATGYGYIQCGEPLGEGAFRVKAFREKPDAATAEMFLAAGNFKWNSGIFIWNVETILDAFRKYSPALLDFAEHVIHADDPWKILDQEFASCPKISIDYAVMEKTENIIVLESRFEWDDVGSWSSLRNQLPCDGEGNVCSGKTVLLDTENSVVISEENHLVGVVGARNMVIVKAGNATLVCPIDEVQRVKDLVKEIALKKLDDYI